MVRAAAAGLPRRRQVERSLRTADGGDEGTQILLDGAPQLRGRNQLFGLVDGNPIDDRRAGVIDHLG